MMGVTTEIGWTDHTFNPWWGCTRVSPGCEHCYAETFAKRTGHKVWGKTSDRRFFGDKHWAEPLKRDRAAAAKGTPALVFCASMADVFEYNPSVHDARQQLWGLIEATPHLIWQLLTKRPENVRNMVPVPWLLGNPGWPDNVWIGTTVEDQQRADERVPELVALPYEATKFLSCEPLLAQVNLAAWLRHIDWVIVGGESGAGHRALNLDHARSVVAECRAEQVAVFFKQVGGSTPKAGGDLLDGVAYKQFPVAS